MAHHFEAIAENEGEVKMTDVLQNVSRMVGNRQFSDLGEVEALQIAQTALETALADHLIDTSEEATLRALSTSLRPKRPAAAQAIADGIDAQRHPTARLCHERLSVAQATFASALASCVKHKTTCSMKEQDYSTAVPTLVTANQQLNAALDLIEQWFTDHHTNPRVFAEELRGLATNMGAFLELPEDIASPVGKAQALRDTSYRRTKQLSLRLGGKSDSMSAWFTKSDEEKRKRTAEQARRKEDAVSCLEAKAAYGKLEQQSSFSFSNAYSALSAGWTIVRNCQWGE